MRAKPVRTIVCVDDGDGKSKAIHDGPAQDVRADPARPGVVSTLIWATDATPARILTQIPRVPDTMEPPSGGSVCRIVALPPDKLRRAPMQTRRTLDFCLILEGEITLVLDTGEVNLRAGDTVVQRGTRHAWSNRSDAPCVIAISSHDATT